MLSSCNCLLCPFNTICTCLSPPFLLWCYIVTILPQLSQHTWPELFWFLLVLLEMFTSCGFMLLCDLSLAANVESRKKPPEKVQWAHGCIQSSTYCSVAFLECSRFCFRWVWIITVIVVLWSLQLCYIICFASDFIVFMCLVPSSQGLEVLCLGRRVQWLAQWLWKRVYQSTTTTRSELW